MKWNNLTKFVAVLGLAMLLATGAFASNKGMLTFQEPVQVNGQQLPAGEYQLRWDGTGPNVEVSFVQGKKEVAKTAAKVVELDTKSAYGSTVVDRSSGTPLVTQVRFAGKKFALELVGEATTASTSSSK